MEEKESNNKSFSWQIKFTYNARPNYFTCQPQLNDDDDEQNVTDFS